MSTEIATLASVQPSPEYILQDAPESVDVDTEMTCVLTATDSPCGIDTFSESVDNANMNDQTSPLDAGKNCNHSQRARASIRANLPRRSTNGFSPAPNAAASPIWRVDDGNGHGTSSPDSKIALSLIKPGPAWPTQAQLSVAYTYGIRRADGKYTMLIPADELADVDFDKVAINQGPEGMIILPPLGQVRPEKRTGEKSTFSSAIVACLPIETGGIHPATRALFDPSDKTQVHYSPPLAPFQH